MGSLVSNCGRVQAFDMTGPASGEAQTAASSNCASASPVATGLFGIFGNLPLPPSYHGAYYDDDDDDDGGGGGGKK
eukprot:2956249-Alexandrium_andersonii.AAC.1